jgi:hypothetical protein
MHQFFVALLADKLLFFMEVLIAGKSLDWLHLFHPEVVCICAQGSYRLFEG